MDIDILINRLQDEWEPETGSLGKLREGFLDPMGLKRLSDLIQSLEVYDRDSIDRRLISLIWFIPMFMEMQVERVKERAYDVHILQFYQHQILNSLFKILGLE